LSGFQNFRSKCTSVDLTKRCWRRPVLGITAAPPPVASAGYYMVFIFAMLAYFMSPTTKPRVSLQGFETVRSQILCMRFRRALVSIM